jgi:pyruvate/2-oxoglutarate dehydrogenase complex dihydrolipoamide acyltransferase (E2) component
MDDARPRRVEITPFPFTRRLVTMGLRHGRRMAPMLGLIQVDVTQARRLLAAHDPPWSMTAFVVACVARAAAAHPEVHAYRDWRGRLVRHHHVDVTTLVELPTAPGLFAVPHILRDADTRGVAELTAELRAVKRQPAGTWLERAAPAVTRVPGAVRAMYAVMARSVAVRQRVGTIAVTAVGMFADGCGFGISPMSLMSLEVVVGGIARRPWVAGDRIEIRDVLDLTVAVDHNVVDGAPATRFVADLRTLIESAAVLPAATGPQIKSDWQR